ncbi:protein javelin [Zeugodacus cucurbitae]|uniref:protein javelin n=1 Tax=Zeugodacus cucurbitae TaxID=28588 RepID=UPI000596977A|nr:protein javelin [Zeugodacus cucurbitae]
MGNGYFRTSQTRKDKRRSKELTYNYVDRVRLAEHSLQQDYRCPTRGSGWRHNNKSISHLDLATSCHSTAFGPSHWPHNRQLRHSRSLDYAHLTERCKDPLEIAEFYWRLDPEGDALYEDEYEDEVPDEENELITRYNGEHSYRDYNYAEGNYHGALANNGQLLHPPHLHHYSGGNGGAGNKSLVKSPTAAAAAATASATLQAFDFGNESCSLRRSRSLAVIREETFSDLQITTANNSRRSQLIPRARIVNRDFIRERERLICGGGANKHHHHHHHHGGNTNVSEELDYEGISAVEQKVQRNNSINAGSRDTGELQQRAHTHLHRHHHHHTSGSGSCSGSGSGGGVGGNNNHDNLQYQNNNAQQQQQSQIAFPQSPTTVAQQSAQPQSREADDYYDNLKRLDALTLGLVEQLHPWHNEKSDLESLNSDYFKNSLHQSHELQQQLDFEALEEAVCFLASEKPRIYQSRRQQRALGGTQQKLQNASDSYQENSQSSAFPETTTSNSDDQTDSPSLSEQEYDLKKIEKIYKKTAALEADEESYELISLTTTTRTRIETTEDEEEEHEDSSFNCNEQSADASDCPAAAAVCVDKTNEHEPINGVLKRTRALSENLEKLIAYDSVYLSSEESSESTLIDENHCGAYERTTQVTAQLAEDTGETATLLHFSIEDIIYEPHNKQPFSGSERTEFNSEQSTVGVACTATVLTETETAEIATQTAQEKQLVSIVETVNTKIEKIPLTANLLEEEQQCATRESTTLYTQILKVGHTSATNPSDTTSTSTTTATATAKASVTTATSATAATTGISKSAICGAPLTTQPTVGITSSAASKPKILSVVEKRKWKRYNDTTTTTHTANAGVNNEAVVQPRGCGLESSTSSASPPIDYPLTSLKKHQSTSVVDTLLYSAYATQLSDNQYHSLPDVTIGQSLKVSESIDAKLRSSYNVRKGELDECCRRAELTHTSSNNTSANSSSGKTTHLLEDTANKCKLKQQREEVVTSEEIYDSIKRFGRAHQKARQKEYQEFHEVHVEKEKKREVKEKRLKVQDTEATKAEVAIEVHTTTTYPDSLAEEIEGKQGVSEDATGAQEIAAPANEVVAENTSVDTNVADETDSNITVNSSLGSSTSEYQEQPKDAPDVEVENFSKLIERRAKEIKAKAGKLKFDAGAVKHTNNAAEITQHKETQQSELYKQQADDYHISSVASQFRIIVTDAQDNIIEEDAIEQDDSLNSADQFEAPPNKTAYQELNLVADVTSSRQEKKEKSTKDKSTIVSTHTRVASLKRVPSKPKRQQHHTAQHHHCCQQQHNRAKNNNSNSNNNIASDWHSQNNGDVTNAPCNGNNKGNGSGSGSINDCHNSNNYCELSIKSKEHRVLSTQIYKARPIKVLTANDSFRRRSTEGAVTAAGSKMSRPQILHVVDNKRRADILGTAKNIRNHNNNSNNFTKAKRAEEGSQVESEYLKKVDAVRNYWAKLAKEGDEQATESTTLDKQVAAKERPNEFGDCQTLKYANKQENVNELTKMKLGAEAQPQKPQPEPRHFILGPQAEGQTQSQSQSTYVHQQPAKPLKPSANQDEFCSFMPSIEIVELDGDKKATIVSAVPPDSEEAYALANDANGEPQFDHIRYKVLKSQQLLRSNMMPRSKKEAQFDGLIQYLQEYSFQELLANNNVVIVEPVRTKIERPLAIAQAVAATKKLAQKPSECSGIAAVTNQALDDGNDSTVELKPKESLSNGGLSNTPKLKEKITREVGETVERAGAGGGIKRHFFYQPVRVNRELYEEELPNPDIVRNVRRFFEENVLPTPRGGMQVLHRPPPDEDTFVERSAATQLPSPRARRSRKYRYLTIDTSYGHMPPQHQNHQSPQQQQPQTQVANKRGISATRKWDTASLSSGISSGDLSSPCECNEMDAACVEKPEAINEEVLKGVHVQTVVQRHNNKNMRHAASEHIDATASGEHNCNGLLQLGPRPRPRSCVVRGNEDATYRISDIYEQHASQQQQRNFTRDDKNGRLAMETATDDEDADDEDLDDEVYESHYISNDVLEKIRECGSTITYYGGRVLQNTSPDPMHTGTNNNYNNNNNSQANTANTDTMTLTRRRVRQIESCNACEPPRDCGNQQAVTQKFPQQSDESHDKNKSNIKGAAAGDGSRESSLAHFGIKFKLVKSNSCSSRLELAGTGIDIVETGADETEVVKKMVHRFECAKTRRQSKGADEPLTINNQMPAKRLLDCGQLTADVVSDVKQVTVNNHINVPMTTYTLEAPTASARRDNIDYTHEEDRKLEMEYACREKTYQSSAMDIRLSHVDQQRKPAVGDVADSGDGNGTLKVWRNRNVDLAFTMALKQQQQPLAGETPSQLAKHSTTATSATVTGTRRILESNSPFKSQNDDKLGGGLNGIPTDGADCQEKINLRSDEDKRQQASHGNDNPTNETLRTLSTQMEAQRNFNATTTPILAPRSNQRPAQIVVPVEIHCADQQTPEPHGRVSVASSRGSSVTTVITTNTTALLDKSVVRHYVANDKSLFEKRKYDDIEFEEFEVYDPTKDFEKLIENEKRREEAKREGQTQPTQQPHHQQQAEQQPVFGDLSAVSLNGANEATTRYHEAEEEDEEDDGRKSKLGSECYDYDSLEDKL